MSWHKVLWIFIFGVTFFVSLSLPRSAEVAERRQAVFAEAACRGNVTLMKALLAAGADLDAPGCPYDSCMRPIVGAAFYGHVNAVSFLLDRGADVNAPMKQGQTALIVASSNGDLPIVKLLLSRGAHANVKYADKTAAAWANESGHLDVAEVLKQAEATDR